MSMRSPSAVLSLAVVAVLGSATGADNRPAQTDEERQLRLHRISTLVAGFAPLVGTEPEAAPARQSSDPVMAYADNARDLTDATLWVWQVEGRPVALTSIEFRPYSDTSGVWSFEFAALTSREMQVTLPRSHWTIPANAVQEGLIPDAPAPATTSRERLLQARKLADRFSAASLSEQQGRIELRRLSAPVYRHAQDGPGADSSLFVFAHGTNPEVALLLESAGSTAGWMYRMAPLSGDASVVLLDDREVWTQQRFVPPGNRDAYRNGRVMKQEDFVRIP